MHFEMPRAHPGGQPCVNDAFRVDLGAARLPEPSPAGTSDFWNSKTPAQPVGPCLCRLVPVCAHQTSKTINYLPRILPLARAKPRFLGRRRELSPLPLTSTRSQRHAMWTTRNRTSRGQLFDLEMAWSQFPVQWSDVWLRGGWERQG
jgi:hypothetical protein